MCARTYAQKRARARAHTHTHTQIAVTHKNAKTTQQIPLMLQLSYSYIGTHAGTKVRAHLHNICIKISIFDVRQETYANRNNSGLFVGLFYYTEQRMNDEKSQ
jgi:hypothetical protein